MKRKTSVRQPVTRESAGRAALQLIDEAGLEAFSLPKLAKRLGISSPSLYHHFVDRNEILAVVARLVYDEALAPSKPRRLEEWPQWVVQNSMNLREAVLKHRNAAPVLLQFLPRDLVTRRYDDGAAFFGFAGVPVHLHIELLDGIEKFSLGAIVAEAMRPAEKLDEIFPVDPEQFPALAEAIEANKFTAAQLHAEALMSFLRGVMQSDQGGPFASLHRTDNVSAQRSRQSARRRAMR